MSLQDDLRRCLEAEDVPGARRLWACIAPSMPQPETDREALIVLHLTRAQTKSIDLKLRTYSHYWLLDRGFPSTLPDNVRKLGERIYPRVVEAVMISANFSSSVLKPARPIVQDAMCETAAECYFDGNTDGEFVRSRILETKDNTLKRLFGDISKLKVKR